MSMTSSINFILLPDVDNLSPMIRGATGPGFYVEAYETEEDLKKILQSHLV